MFNNRLSVFILGAGAHVPYGFPTMVELKKLIISQFPTQIKDYATSGTEKGILSNDASDFVRYYNLSPLESIDKYLSLNNHFALLGKQAIFYNLLSKETAYFTGNYR